MIITVTLNTSIDKCYYMSKEITDYSVMRVDKVINSAGGKGLNVARSIHLLQNDVLATGFVGGHNGKYLLDMLNDDEIANDFVEVKNETRSCINIIDANKKSTEFLEPGFEVEENEVGKFIKHFTNLIDKCNVVTFSGSVAKGINKDIYGRLIKIANDKNKITVLDSSGDLFKNAINSCPTLVKPNLEELEAIFDIKINTKDDLKNAANRLLNCGIKYVVISLGEDGAFIKTKDECYIAKAKNINVVNTVGSGDCMVGALAVGLQKGLNVKDLIHYAVSVGSGNVTNERTGFFELDTVENIYKQVEIENL